MTDSTLTPGLDVLILADTADTASVETLLDDISELDNLMQVVLVAYENLDVRPGVKIVTVQQDADEAAALAEGLKAADAERSTITAVVPGDAAEAARLIPPLVDALGAPENNDVAVISGTPECSVWQTQALLDGVSKVDGKGAVETLVKGARATEISGTGEEKPTK